jgi:hypothetical protein
MSIKVAIIRCCIGTAAISVNEFIIQDRSWALYHAVMYFLVGSTWWEFAVKSHPQAAAKTSI